MSKQEKIEELTKLRDAAAENSLKNKAFPTLADIDGYKAMFYHKKICDLEKQK